MFVWVCLFALSSTMPIQGNVLAITTSKCHHWLLANAMLWRWYFHLNDYNYVLCIIRLFSKMKSEEYRSLLTNEMHFFYLNEKRLQMVHESLFNLTYRYSHIFSLYNAFMDISSITYVPVYFEPACIHHYTLSVQYMYSHCMNIWWYWMN